MKKKESLLSNKTNVSKKAISLDWKDSLTSTFLKNAANRIKLFNYIHKTPIIFAEEGVIYKVVKSEKTELGKIKKISRKINENSYTIE